MLVELYFDLTREIRIIYQKAMFAEKFLEKNLSLGVVVTEHDIVHLNKLQFLSSL